jgi:hypothetical protein
VLEYAYSQVRRFTTEEVLASLDIEKGRMTPRDGGIISNILRRNGFSQERTVDNGRKIRVWTRRVDQ